MTTHAPTQAAVVGLSPAELDAVTATGFINQVSSRALNAVIADQEYSWRVFHAYDHLRKRSSAFFEIREIMPGTIGTHQDLVEMRRS